MTTGMTKIDLPYIKAYKDRYGKWRYYYRRNKQRQAIKGTPGSYEFLECYNRIHATFEACTKDRARSGTFGALVEAYYAAPEFAKNLKGSTKDEYRRHIEPMRDAWHDIALSGITRKVLRAYRDSLSNTPRTANAAVAVISTVYTWAIEAELTDTNPAKGIKPIRIETEGWKPWPAAALERFSSVSTDAPRIAFFLALYTGQRLADVLKMRWDAITDDGFIMVKQEKKRAKHPELYIPIHPALAQEIEATRQRYTDRTAKRRAKDQTASTPLTIVAKRDGTQYTEDGFESIWNRQKNKHGCNGLPFHGLRKNATQALMEAGCTEQQAQAITGHETTGMIQHYARKANQRRLATDAMGKLVAMDQTKARTKSV
jgi:integrase